MREEEFSAAEAREFIIEHGMADMLRELYCLWKPSPKEMLNKIEGK